MGTRELSTQSPLHLSLQKSPPQTSPKIWYLVTLLLHSLRWALSLTKSWIFFSVSWVFLGLCFSESSRLILNWERCRGMFLTNNYQLKSHKGISWTQQMTTSYQLTLLRRQEDWKRWLFGLKYCDTQFQLGIEWNIKARQTREIRKSNSETQIGTHEHLKMYLKLKSLSVLVNRNSPYQSFWLQMYFLLKINYKTLQSIILYCYIQTCSCSQFWITQLTQKNEGRSKHCFSNPKSKPDAWTHSMCWICPKPVTEENLTQNSLLRNIKRNICYSLSCPWSIYLLAVVNAGKPLCKHQESICFVSICDFMEGHIPEYFSGSTNLISQMKKKKKHLKR